ncbi:TerB family tellurite resistance protein [Alcanivorax sp. 24]|uniref:tellurite resistance TerB family protein n=1 Tax=Alcanivorax sp. 24 TaxID=2545266 RepID=UPI00105E864E|nr:TerB family tellurite resistance protein [Alcanivorax sp. 24]
MNWIARLFEPQTTREPVTELDLHRAAAALLLEVARTDGQIDEREKQSLFKAVRQRWQLDSDELEEIVAELHERVEGATDLYEFTSPLREHWGPEPRARLIEDMWAVAAADGKADVHEEHLIRRVADLLYVSHGDYIRAKLAATGEQ